MRGSARRGAYYAFVLLLLCAVAVGQSAAFSSVHEQHQAEGHNCLVCYAGTLPFLQSASVVPAAPVLRVVWIEPAPDFTATHDRSAAARTSRAPPA